MNSMPKYVVSRSLKEASWNNSTIIDASPAEAISKLKRGSGGVIMLYGSADLLHSLIRTDIIDEYRIMVFPVVLGSGKHLFRDESDTSHLRLTDTRRFSSGAVLLTYRPTDESPGVEFAVTMLATPEAVEEVLFGMATGSGPGRP
jgi:dihydrofolate reductase